MSVKPKSGRNSAEGNKLGATQPPIDDKKKGSIKSKLRKFFSRNSSTSGSVDVDDAEGPNTGDEDVGNLSSSSSRLKSASLEDITAPDDSKQSTKQPHFHRSMEGIADAFKADLNASIQKGKLRSSNNALKAANTPSEADVEYHPKVKGLPPLPTKATDRSDKNQDLKSSSSTGVFTELSKSPTMHRRQQRNEAKSVDYADLKQEEDKIVFDFVPSMPTTRAPPLPASVVSKGGHGKPRNQSEPLSLNLDPLPSLAVPLANASQKDRIAVRNRNRRPMTVAQRQSDEKSLLVESAPSAPEKAAATSSTQVPILLPPISATSTKSSLRQRTNSDTPEPATQSPAHDEDVDSKPVDAELVAKATKTKSRRSIDGGTPSRKSRRKHLKSEESVDLDLAPDDLAASPEAAAASGKSDDDVMVTISNGGDEASKPVRKHKKHRSSKIVASDDQLQDSDDLLESPEGRQQVGADGEPISSADATKVVKKRKSKKKSSSSKIGLARSESTESLDELGDGAEIVVAESDAVDQDVDVGSEVQSSKKKKHAKERKKHRDRGDSETGVAEAKLEPSVEVAQSKKSSDEQLPPTRSNGGSYLAPSEHVTTVQIQELTLDDSFSGSMKMERSEPMLRRPTPLGASVKKPPAAASEVEFNPPDVPERRKDERNLAATKSPDFDRKRYEAKSPDFERKRYEAKSPDLDRKKYDSKAPDLATGKSPDIERKTYILKQSDFTGAKSPDFERKKYESKSPDVERKKEISSPDFERPPIRRNVLIDDEKRKMQDVAKELGSRVNDKTPPTNISESKFPAGEKKPISAAGFGSTEKLNTTDENESELSALDRKLKKSKKNGKEKEVVTEAIDLPDETVQQNSPRRGSGEELKASTTGKVADSASVGNKSPQLAAISKDVPKLPKLDPHHIGSQAGKVAVTSAQEEKPQQQAAQFMAVNVRDEIIVVKKKPLPPPPTLTEKPAEEVVKEAPAVRVPVGGVRIVDVTARQPLNGTSGSVDNSKQSLAKATAVHGVVTVSTGKAEGVAVVEAATPAKRPPPVPPKKVKAEPARVVGPSQPTVTPPLPPPKPLKKPMMENAEPTKRDFVRDVLLDSQVVPDDDDDGDEESGGNKAISFSKAAQFRWSERKPSAAKRDDKRLIGARNSSTADAKADNLKKELASLAAAKVAANLEEKENNKSGTASVTTKSSASVTSRDRPPSITDGGNGISSSAYNPRPFLRPTAPKSDAQRTAPVPATVDVKPADKQEPPGLGPASNESPHQLPPWLAMARMKSTNWSQRFPKSDKTPADGDSAQ